MSFIKKIEFASNKDTALALANSTNHLKELNHNIYNLGGGEAFRTTYREFLINMLKIYGIKIK